MSDDHRGLSRLSDRCKVAHSFPGELDSFRSIFSRITNDESRLRCRVSLLILSVEAKRGEEKREAAERTKKVDLHFLISHNAPGEAAFVNLLSIDFKLAARPEQYRISVLKESETMENAKQTISIIIEFGSVYSNWTETQR